MRLSMHLSNHADMYNELAYNAGPYNGSPTSESEAIPTTLLQFDGFDLNSSEGSTTGDRILIQNLDDSGPMIDLDKIEIPLGNGVKINSRWRRGKIIEAEGVVFSDSGSELEAFLDTIKKNLRKINKTLDVTKYGVTRRYPKTTLLNMDSLFRGRKGSDITRCPISMQFLVSDVGTDWDYEQTTDEITAAEDTITTESDGTTEALPIIIVVFSAVSGVSTLNIQIDENEQEIEIPYAFTGSEAVVIDCEEETVTVNGVEVEFSGRFPEMALGTNTFRFTTDGASRTFRATILAKNYFL
jgi:hypothetical protein